MFVSESAPLALAVRGAFLCPHAARSYDAAQDIANGVVSVASMKALAAEGIDEMTAGAAEIGAAATMNEAAEALEEQEIED